MDRRAFIVLMLAGTVLPRLVRAQPTQKVWKVGYISMRSPAVDRQWVGALREGLRDLGYVEGRNLVFEQRHAGDIANVSAVASELVQGGAAVLVVDASPALPTLKKRFPNVPIVMTVHPDPVGSGIVASLARPGGNLTGLTDGHVDLAPKRLELLKELVPSFSRAGVMFNPGTPHAVRQWKLVEAVGPTFGVAVVPIEVKGPRDLDRAFETTRKEQVAGLVLAPDPTWWTGDRQRVGDLAIKQRLPTIGSLREFAENGILLAYGTNFVHLWRKSASYVDKIIKGAKASELAIEHPTKFDLVLNLKTAKAMGISVPRSLLLRVDAVIE
jgi:putative tryptophan/tyrosine transport system substrate-binding protein